jgi:translation initiation factor IF-1
MPGHRSNEKPRNRLAVVAEKRNNANVQSILKGGMPEIQFARITKHLGNGYFILSFHDGESLMEIQGEPRGFFKKGKVNMRFSAGDFVMVEGTDGIAAAHKAGKKLIVEISGILDRATVAQLNAQGRIHSSLMKMNSDGVVGKADEGDDMFDYEEEAPEGAEAADGGAAGRGGRREPAAGAGGAAAGQALVQEHLRAAADADADIDIDAI